MPDKLVLYAIQVKYSQSWGWMLCQAAADFGHVRAYSDLGEAERVITDEVGFLPSEIRIVKLEGRPDEH